jgi:hypothetical protein
MRRASQKGSPRSSSQRSWQQAWPVGWRHSSPPASASPVPSSVRRANAPFDLGGGGQKTIIFIPQPGGVEQHQQTAPRRGQEGPGSPYAPQGRPGGAVVRPEPREAPQSSAAPSQDAGPHQASGGWQPVQEERPGGTPPDGQAPNERQSAAPDDSDQPVPSDEPHADRPPAEQPVRQLPSIFQ